MSQKNSYILFTTAIILVITAFLYGQKLAKNQLTSSLEPNVQTKAEPLLTPEERINALHIPLNQSVEQRAELSTYIENHQTFFLRDKYEEVIDKVGANGIIDVVETLYPVCHDRLHDLGKIIYAEVQEIGPSLRVCEDACYSACMHGVMMEAFGKAEEEIEPHEHTEEELGFHIHVGIEDIKKKVGDTCTQGDVTESYKPGDCMHGVGHAVMVLANYDIGQALEYCEIFDEDKERYYCATGVFMEYNNTYGQQDYEEGKLFEPCTEYDYPGACFRYKLPPVFALHYKQERQSIELIQVCLSMEKKNRLGCMHGVGNAHVAYIAAKKVSLEKICSFGNEDDQYICIEGAMERMARYHPAEAEETCKTVQEPWKKDLCEQSVENQLYSLDKPFDLYL